MRAGDPDGRVSQGRRVCRPTGRTHVVPRRPGVMGRSLHDQIDGDDVVQPRAQNVYDIASATSQPVSTAAPCRKSSISMASRGLWLPLALRTNTIADGTPATVKVAVSCEAGLASGMVAMASASAT